MSNGREKLVRDLKILEEMAAEMKDYLASQELFWPKIDGKLMQPTLGGFWLRRHRLVTLQNSLLDAQQRTRLKQAMQLFDDACADQSRAVEQKGSRELEARLRQWAGALEELLEDEQPSPAYYRSDVEIRAIIQALLGHFAPLPSERKAPFLKELETLDHQLAERWVAGKFIWPAEWAPAYPRPAYWWLYGQLKPPED